MNSLFQLVSLFSLLSTGVMAPDMYSSMGNVDVSTLSSFAKVSSPSAEIAVDFKNLDAAVMVGDRVVFHGTQVGSVSRVLVHADASENTSTQVVLSVKEALLPAELTSSDFVALISHVNSVDESGETKSGAAQIELVHVLGDLSDLDMVEISIEVEQKESSVQLSQIRGFSTLKEFWGSSLSFQPRI